MHIPVLTEKVLAYLDPTANENFIDCTMGEGGHAPKILERTGPKGKLLGIDMDPDALQRAGETLKRQKERIIFVQGSFAHLKMIAEKEKFRQVHGILFDLGFSSNQIEKSKRGFSFLRAEPLDMRFDPENPVTAQKFINYASKQELVEVLKEYGEERFANAIAQGILRERRHKPIATTFQLVKTVEEAVPGWYKRRRIHPATKTFQALRIAVNKELDNLKVALPQALEMLSSSGRLVVISYHSFEDRIVKNFFRANPALTILTKKPVVPSANEIRKNPRSRSAKLRAALKR